MKLGLTVNCWVDEDLMFAQQFGVSHIVAQATLPEWAQDKWDVSVLKALRNRVERAGLVLAGLDRLPCCLDRAVLGGEGRDDAIGAACRFIEMAGAAGVPVVGYAWATTQQPAITLSPQGRGGALVAERAAAIGTRSAKAGATIQAWDNLTRFLERVIPVAERAGVSMACRPQDPLAAQDGDAPGILSNVAGLQKLIDLAPSPCNGLDLVQRALAVLPGTDVAEIIRRFGARKAILLATLQNYTGQVPAYSQTFLDEGDTNMLAALRTYQEVGFEGVVRPGAQPGMLSDTSWGHKGQAFAVGYLRALLQVVQRGEAQKK